MPPPCHAYHLYHWFYASPFFFAAVLFGFAAVSAETGSETFLVAVFLSLAFIEFRLREFPKEPFEILPFFVFLSPLPIFLVNFTGQL